MNWVMDIDTENYNHETVTN